VGADASRELEGGQVKIAYKNCPLRAEGLKVVDQANDIIKEYQKQGFTLTLRQLYYQFVARELIPNNMRSYKRLGTIIDEGRLGGLIDWEAIEDRTRELSKLATWDSPAEIVEACANQFRIDLWATQPYHVEVWVEKEALAGVVETACNKWQVPFLSCRGYTSQSEMWRGGRRLLQYYEEGKKVLILHLGDHDPSGIDMSRDIQNRLSMFMEGNTLRFIRMALNMDQIKKFRPPPNPAKATDSRFAAYQNKFGDKSWELDALEPKVITGLISSYIRPRINRKAWRIAKAEEGKGKDALQEVVADLKETK